MRSLWPVVVLSMSCQTISHVARPQPPAELPTVESVEVSLVVPDVGPIDVTLTLPARVLKRAPKELEFPLLGKSTGYYASLIRPALTPLPVKPNEPIVLHYSVDLPLLAVPTEEVLLGSFQALHGKHLSLRAMVPLLPWLPRTEAVVVRVKAEAPIASTLPGNGGVFVTRDLRALYSGLVLIGPLREVEGTSGLRIASFDFDDAVLTRAAELELRTAARMAQLCGARQDLKMLLLYQEPAGHRQALGGVNNGQAAIVLQRRAPDGRSSSSDGNTLIHELVHSSLATDPTMPHWVTEGFTEYYARRLSLELDGYGEGALQESLADTWRAFLQKAPDRRAQGGLSDYFGGATLAYCVDARLRHDGSSLDAVLKRARERSRGQLTVEPWEQELALASAPAGGLVYSAKHDEPLTAFEECLALDGFALEPGEEVDVDDTVNTFGAEFALEGGGRESGLTVARSLRGSPFEVGDVIVSVEGQRLITAERFLTVLDQLRDRTSLKVGVLRGPKQLDVTVPVPQRLDFRSTDARPRVVKTRR